jgi:aldose 1-epimerase
MTISQRPFGSNGTLFTLTTASGMAVSLTDFGASIVSILTPDRKGQLADVVLGYDDADGYATGRSYQGCTVGRYGNRIGGARFDIDGHSYALTPNNGPHSLHGGVQGFHCFRWEATVRADGVTFTRVSPHGEEGFPGNLSVAVTYTLDEAQQLTIDYQATTDAPTHVNLTNHSYFNLAGPASSSVLDHRLWIGAESLLQADPTLIPTGETMLMEGTAFDFSKPKALGLHIATDDDQLRYGHGYDHCFIVQGPLGELRLAATLDEPTSGRLMEVLTTEPAIQLYTGNFLDGTESGKGRTFTHRSAVCLETQHYPNTPNEARFPTTLLRPGEGYQTQTIYRFGIAP